MRRSPAVLPLPLSSARGFRPGVWDQTGNKRLQSAGRRMVRQPVASISQSWWRWLLSVCYPAGVRRGAEMTPTCWASSDVVAGVRGGGPLVVAARAEPPDRPV